MSNPSWMNGGQAPQQQYAQPQQLPQANAAANMHWINAIATAKLPGERLPRLSAGHSYVLDAESFVMEPSADPAKPGAFYFGATFRVVESTDHELPPGSVCTKRENLATYGGPGRSQAIITSALESFAQQRVELANVDQIKQAIAFVVQQPCPIAGKSRVYAVATAANKSGPDGKPYVNVTWEPMPHTGTKGLTVVATLPGPPGVFAGMQAPAPAQPWTPQGAAPAVAPGAAPWPAGIVQTNGQGSR